MSGGHFQYQQYRIEEIAVEIDEMIGSNDDQSVDEWGQRRVDNYPPEILEKFREAAHTLRQAAEMAQRVDWLVSGDDGEESFHRRWRKEVRPYWANARAMRPERKEPPMSKQLESLSGSNLPTCPASLGRDIILIVDMKCPECHAIFGTHFSPTNPPEKSWEDVMCRECKAVWNYSDELQKTLDSDPVISPQNANVDLPDTAAQDSASKSNNPAVSG